MNTNVQEELKVESENDISIFSSAGKFGLNGLKYFVLVIFLYSIINIFFFVLSIFKLSVIDSNFKYILCVLLVLVIGVLCTAGALYLTYKYLIIDGIGVIYKHMTPFFKKLSVSLVDKAESSISENGELKSENLKKTVDTGKMLNDVYGRKVPKLVQKGINLILSLIPFSDLLFNIKDNLQNNDKEKTSLILYNSIDNYIKDSILGNNTMKFLYWAIPVNIAIQLVLIFVLRLYLSSDN